MVTSDSESFYVLLRGLPWSATQQEIMDFMPNVTVPKDKEGVHIMINREGRPSGEAFIEVADREDVQRALEKDRAYMGKRYVEVLEATPEEFDRAIRRYDLFKYGQPNKRMHGYDSEAVVRLRGLPYSIEKSAIAEFFSGLDISQNGILIITDSMGRNTGDAFVHFTSREQVGKALEKHKQCIGHRYIEVFKSNLEEASREASMSAPGSDSPVNSRGPPPRGQMDYHEPYYGPSRSMHGSYDRYDDDRGRRDDWGHGPNPSYDFDDRRGPSEGFQGYNDDGYGPSYGRGGPPGGPMRRNMGPPSQYCISMRGLPFSATKPEILQWFSQVADPIHVELKYNNAGRPAGEAEVFFNSVEELEKALTKDRENMQHRYIELYRKTVTSDYGGGRSMRRQGRY